MLKIIFKNYRFRHSCYFSFKSKKSPHNNLINPNISNYKCLMKYLILSKRSKALVGIGILAIIIGLISKKVINYPTGGCVEVTQVLTFII